MKVDIDEVRGALTATAVLEAFGIEGKRSGSQYRLRVCPRCGDKSSSKAIAIDVATGDWLHHGHQRAAGGQCSGDVIDLVAAYEGLDCRKDFARVLERAAQIAGIDAMDPRDREVRRAELEAKQAERARVAAREEARITSEAKLKASANWRRAVRRNRAGEAYLRSRGIGDATMLIESGFVAFDTFGNVHVPLWTLDDSELVNVCTRMIAPAQGAPRTPVLAGCPTLGTLCGRIAEITEGVTVMITEGIIDTLSAIHRWPDRVALGAHSAGRMMHVAEAVAARVKAKHGSLVLVPDGDESGQGAAVKAGVAAIEAGLVMGVDLHVLDLGTHHDLNAAHVAGWAG